MVSLNTVQRDRSHQQNLSINSIGSLIEPVTPPEIHENKNTPNHSDPSMALSFSSYSQNSDNMSSTPLTIPNANIGGNTMRSRFKSLPLGTDTIQQFHQLNSSRPKGLSLDDCFNSQLASTSPNHSSSIPQISLQQYYKETLTQDHGKQTIFHQRFPSVPVNNSLGAPPKDSLMVSSNFKNYDELNLIPIENLDILKLFTDQYGCRYLQKKLDTDSTMKDVIFNKVFNNMIDLIVDPFGNYLTQKLVDHMTEFQIDLMIEKIHPFLFQISISQYGTRSLQKIIDNITNSYQMDLVVKGLKTNDTVNPADDNNIIKLIKDLNGNHVIQKCIFQFPPEKFQFIIDSICINNNIVRISTHKHGCCVLQKLLNNANFDQILKIAQVLLIFLDQLINDQFGNYIIQFLFELDLLKVSDTINYLIDDFFKKIYTDMINLSCLKFSSNVIEKFIKVLKLKKKFVYLNEIIRLTNANFEILIKDKFGNYVIQTLIDQFHDVRELNIEITLLINTVKTYLPVIKSTPYARKLELKIQQLETNYTFSLSSSSSINTPVSFSPSSSYNRINYNQARHDVTNQLPHTPHHFNVTTLNQNFTNTSMNYYPSLNQHLSVAPVVAGSYDPANTIDTANKYNINVSRNNTTKGAYFH